MSYPVIEYIAEDIEAAINAITRANGFNQDLVAVRPRRNDFSDIAPVDGTVLIWQDDETEPEEQLYSTQSWVQPFCLQVIVLDSDTAVSSIDTRLNQVRADIHKKLREDITRGGYAYETEIAPSIKFDEGIAVFVNVHYRTKENDPYQKG